MRPILIIFAQAQSFDEQEWPCRSGIDTMRVPGAPVFDEVPGVISGNPNYSTYHIIISPTTGETLKVYGCKGKVEDNFCGICLPETKFGVIDASLLDPNYQYIPPVYKRTEPWSLTPLYAPRGSNFYPESAIVEGRTWRRDEPDTELRIIWTGVERRYQNDARVSWVSWHPAWIQYCLWKQQGLHEATYMEIQEPPNPPIRRRIYNYSLAQVVWW